MMAVTLKGLLRGLTRTPEARDEEPIRDELFSVERLEQYATTLAAEHRVYAGRRRGRRLLPGLEKNGRLLFAAYRSLAEAVRSGRSISPAAEWLVDNFHIVEEQLREIREDLPEGYYYELPKLSDGELKDYPRIYAVALSLIAHTDSRLDAETLRRFVRAYQQTTPLTIGELWAVAITLRLALVENLRRLATRIVASREAREEADALADKLLEAVERHPESLTSLLAGRLGKNEDLDRAFVVQLTQRLRDQDPAFMPVFDWLERRLQKRGLTTEQAVHLEHQRQAAAQVTVGNIITSMRLLSTLDWRDFFESVSLVDPLLGEDPAGVYAHMDFHTRDRYRHVIERIAKRTGSDELEVARGAVQLASDARAEHPQDTARAHVGYYLIDDEVVQLEQVFRYRPRPRERVVRSVLRHPTFFYLGTLALITALVVAALCFMAYQGGASQAAARRPRAALAHSGQRSGAERAQLGRDAPVSTAPVAEHGDASRASPKTRGTMVVVPTLFTERGDGRRTA